MKTETQTIMLAMDNLTILRLQEVIFLTGLSRTTISKLIAKGEFPNPISINTPTLGWIENQVIDWLRLKVGLTS
jgi:prophage regulatory protein